VGVNRPAVLIELASDPAFARDLAAGGVFVPNCTLAIQSECDVVVKAGEVELRLPARVVYVDAAKGSGLELIGFGPAIKAQLAALSAPPPVPEGLELELETDTVDEGATQDDRATSASDADDDDARERTIPKNVHERLRHLTVVEQVRVAQGGEMQERIVLERMYGKTVWESLLRNPRITGAEVARIARMGALPRPMIELIVGNGGWLQIPEIRRALLSNPRLGTDQILKILRLMPRHELKIAPKQPAYPQAVRDAAKRMLLGG
jgi:hypothetical protein